MISFKEIIFKILLITSLRKKAKWICKVKQFVYFQENKYVKDECKQRNPTELSTPRPPKKELQGTFFF